MAPEEFAREWLPGLLSPAAPPGLVDEVRSILVEFHPAGQRVMPRAFGDADQRGVLARIAVPTLLLYGDQDVRAPVKIGEDLRAAIPNSRLVVLPGAGQLCDIEAGARFNAEVRGFLGSAAD